MSFFFLNENYNEASFRSENSQYETIIIITHNGALVK